MFTGTIKIFTCVFLIIQLSHSSLIVAKQTNNNFTSHIFNAGLLQPKELRFSALGDIQYSFNSHSQIGSQALLAAIGAPNFILKHKMLTLDNSERIVSLSFGAATLLETNKVKNFFKNLYPEGALSFGSLKTSKAETKSLQSNLGLYFVTGEFNFKDKDKDNLQNTGFSLTALFGLLGFDYKLASKFSCNWSLFFPLGKLLKIEYKNQSLINRFFTKNSKVLTSLSLLYHWGNWAVEVSSFSPDVTKQEKYLSLLNFYYTFK